MPCLLFSQVKVVRNDTIINKSLLLIKNKNRPFSLNLNFAIDSAAMAKQDIEENKLGFPFRFGKSFNVDIGLNNGNWTDTVGGRVWTLQITSAKAHSLNFQLDQFYLGNGTEMMLYNNSGTMRMGPFSNKQNNSHNNLATDLMDGNSVIFHIFEPDSVKGTTQFHIARIIHGYKKTFIGVGYGQSGSCEVDVACSQGANWQTESHSVAMLLLSSGTRFCSASLLNDVCNDFRAFVLTAFHCVDINEDGTISDTEANDVNFWVFRFNYRSPTCSGGDGTNYISYNGAN